MAEKLLVNVTHEETRVALVDGGVLSNLEIDTRKLVHTKGNVYKGVIHRVNQSLQAAFVDYGAEKQGFLPVSEIHDRYYPAAVRGKRVPIQEILREGQELMVQVVKDEIGNKGASLSSYVSLPGRYLVLMPDTGKTGISRRLDGDERKRLKRVIADLPVPDGFGVIIRTAGVEREEVDLAQDLEYLSRLWDHLEEGFKTIRGAGLIHRERSLTMRFIRDYVTGGIDEILVDERDTYEEIQGFCQMLMPEMRSRVRFYNDTTPLFSRYQIEDQIDDVFARKIELPSGGSIVIDQAEALVAIDVNSGRVKTDDIEKTALKTNLEAATEVARQLKLRDLGGLIVVDFIDMRSKENTRDVETSSRAAFEADKAKVKFSRISEFGLMEISRQRLKSSIMKGSFNSCSGCGGTGRLRSVESSALYLLRRMKEAVLRGTNYMHVTAKMPVDVANYLLNRKRRELTELEAESSTSIDIKGVVNCLPTRAYVEILAASGKGRGARRLLLTFDLVRSDVERRELEHLEEIVIDAAHARGLDLNEDQYANLYRRIEADMSNDAEHVAALHAIETKAAVRSAVDTERSRAHTEHKEKAAGGGITGWFTNLFATTEEPAKKTPKEPSRRTSERSAPTKPGSDRRSSSPNSRRRRRNQEGSSASSGSSGSGSSASSGSSERDGGGRGERGPKGEGRGGRRGGQGDGQGSRQGSSDPSAEAQSGEGPGGNKRRRRRRRRGRGGGGEAGTGAEGQGSERAPETESYASEGERRDNRGRGRGRQDRDSQGSRGEEEAKGSAPTIVASPPAPERAPSQDATGDTVPGAAPKPVSAKVDAAPAAPRAEASPPSESAPPARKPSRAAKPKKSDEAPPAAAPKPSLPKAGGVIDLRASGLTLPSSSEAPPAQLSGPPSED
jgi:ribonuclease E